MLACLDGSISNSQDHRRYRYLSLRSCSSTHSHLRCSPDPVNHLRSSSVFLLWAAPPSLRLLRSQLEVGWGWGKSVAHL